MSDNYYSILGVEKNSDENTIKKAYKKLSLKWHPDRNQSDEATSKFQEISEAYAVLSDSKKRDLYDRFGKEGLDNAGVDIDPQDIFKNFFGNNMGFSMGGGMPFDMFGGTFNSGNREQRKGPNKKFELNLSIDEMMNGGKKKISISRKSKCSTCSGSGLKSGKVEKKCSKCGGNGMIFIQRQMGPMITRQSMQCQNCNGTGKIVDNKDRCPACKGNKYENTKEEHTLDLPIGVKHGDYEVLHNKGDESENCQEAGDLIFIFRSRVFRS